MIGPVRLELLTQEISFLLGLMKLHVVLFCRGADAGQSHLPHQVGHIFCADLMAPLNQDGADLSSAQYLSVFIKYFLG